MTILGQHTVAELQDLVDSHQILIDAVTTKRLARKSPIDTTWDLDWMRFLSRWNTAKNKSKVVMAAALAANTSVGPQVIPAEGTYTDVLKALQVNYPNGPWTTGDWQDLSNRFYAAGETIDSSIVDKFQKTAVNSTDLDVEGFKVSDASIRAGESGIKSLPWGKIALGTLSIGVVLIVVNKHL